jgi:hypothetical protein
LPLAEVVLQTIVNDQVAFARTQRPHDPKDFENEVRRPKTDFISKDALNPKNNFSYPDLNQAKISGIATQA